MSNLNTTPPGIPDKIAIDRSVPTYVKLLGLVVLFGLGVATGIVITMMAYEFEWISKVAK